MNNVRADGRTGRPVKVFILFADFKWGRRPSTAEAAKNPSKSPSQQRSQRSPKGPDKNQKEVQGEGLSKFLVVVRTTKNGPCLPNLPNGLIALQRIILKDSIDDDLMRSRSGDGIEILHRPRNYHASPPRFAASNSAQCC